MKRNGFTLIELLLVVAIIGILAAVGVVAYNGYTKSAKVNVVKSNHGTFVKKVSLINQECNLNGSVSLMKNRNDKTLYNVACYSPSKTTFFELYLIDDMNNNQFINPYKAKQVTAFGITASLHGACAASYDDTHLGWVWIKNYDSTNHVTLCSCFKSPCSDSKNRLENKIYLD